MKSTFKRQSYYSHWFCGPISLFLTLGYLPTVKAQSPRSSIQFDTLTKRIQRIMKRDKTPGVQVLVFTKDSLRYKFNGGVMNLKSKVPVTDQSMFRLGSITKSFVAVSALILLEKKQLSLSEELKKAAPDIKFSNPWENTDPVRLVHLLEHTTGFDDLALKDYAVSDPAITLQKGLDTSVISRRSRWRPGTFMAYCNSGPAVVARVIEKKTGQEFESFVRQNIFNPLGLKTITFRQDGAALTHLVTNYSGGNPPKEEKYWHILERPAGSLNAPALELMSFVQMLMNRGTYKGAQLLQAASVDRMEIPTASLAAKAGLKEGYGLHNYTTSYKGYVFHGHDGGVNGGLAHYLYNVELNLGLIVLVNSSGVSFGKINDAVLEVALKNTPQRLPPTYTLSSTEKESLLGFYRASNVRVGLSYWLEWLADVYQISEQDGKFVMKNLLGGVATSIRPVSANQFIRPDKEGHTPAWALVRNDDRQLVLTNNNFQTITTTSAVGAWLPIILAGIALLMAIAIAVAGIVWLIQYGLQKRQKQVVTAMPVRMPLWAYAISLLLFLGAGAYWISADPFVLGTVGAASTILFAASALTAVFGIWAFINLVRYQRRIPGRADRTFLWIAVCSALLVIGYMAVWGLIGLRLWT